MPACRHHRSRHHAVDLNPVLNSLLGKCFGECNDGGVDRRHRGEPWLRVESGAPGNQNHGTFRGLQRFPSPHRQPARTVEFKSYAVIPLRVRHFKQINLGYGARDIEQGIDPAKTFEGPRDNGLGSPWFSQVGSKNHCFRAGRHDFVRRLFQVVLAPGG
jgi:hypothetical protein